MTTENDVLAHETLIDMAQVDGQRDGRNARLLDLAMQCPAEYADKQELRMAWHSAFAEAYIAAGVEKQRGGVDGNQRKAAPANITAPALVKSEFNTSLVLCMVCAIGAIGFLLACPIVKWLF